MEGHWNLMALGFREVVMIREMDTPGRKTVTGGEDPTGRSGGGDLQRLQRLYLEERAFNRCLPGKLG